ncbi:MAG: hypothetical protein D6709_06585 [Chloroflexi bacterium]|nr:MAG: hypothetical protein D6709_06585 [Chloroflexota bacterium]
MALVVMVFLLLLFLLLLFVLVFPLFLVFAFFALVLVVIVVVCRAGHRLSERAVIEHGAAVGVHVHHAGVERHFVGDRALKVHQLWQALRDCAEGACLCDFQRALRGDGYTGRCAL